MPIAFSTCLELDLVYERWSGTVRFDEFRASFGRYLQDVHYRPGRPELIDLSRLAETDLNFEKMRAMLALVNRQSPHNKVRTRTVIFAPYDVFYGLGRMYQQLAELAQGIEVEVYSHETDALWALGLEASSIAALLRSAAFLPVTTIRLA